MGNQLRERTEYMFCTMYVTARLYFLFLISCLVYLSSFTSVFLKSGNWEVVWDAGPAGDRHSAPDDYTVRGLHPGEWRCACVPRNDTRMRVLTVRVFALKWGSVAAVWVRFYQERFKKACFISSRSGRGKKEMRQTTTQQFKWVGNTNHNRMCRPFEIGFGFEVNTEWNVLENIRDFFLIGTKISVSFPPS